MIPRLAADHPDASPKTAFLSHIASLGLEGEIGRTAAERNVFATDNSIYQVEPAAIIFPRNADDLKRIAKALARPEFAEISIARAAAERGRTASR